MTATLGSLAVLEEKDRAMTFANIFLFLNLSRFSDFADPHLLYWFQRGFHAASGVLFDLCRCIVYFVYEAYERNIPWYIFCGLWM